MKNKNNEFNFNLENSQDDQKQSNYENLIDPQPLSEFQEKNNDSSMISQKAQDEFNLSIRNRTIKNVRLQVDITNELEQTLKQWMKKNKVSKKTDAVEALLRYSLGMKQII